MRLSNDLFYMYTRCELVVTRAWANGRRFQNCIPNSIHTSPLHHIINRPGLPDFSGRNIEKTQEGLCTRLHSNSGCTHVREIYIAYMSEEVGHSNHVQQNVYITRTQPELTFRKYHAQPQHTCICTQSLAM